MVEITLSIVLQIVQTIALIVGVYYYISTIRTNQRNQRMAEEARQMQIMLAIGVDQDEVSVKRRLDLMKMKWKDYDDFNAKYGSDVNPDNYLKRNIVWNQWDVLGQMLKRGLVDREVLFERTFSSPYYYWAKFGDVIKENRVRYNQPLSFLHFEYLTEECRKYLEEKGFNTTIPDIWLSYEPDTQ